jgi:hypothetical protein
MAKYSMPDRDKQSRFLPEDDRERSRGYRGGQPHDEEGRYSPGLGGQSPALRVRSNREARLCSP